jgi:hypothetical protein
MALAGASEGCSKARATGSARPAIAPPPVTGAVAGAVPPPADGQHGAGKSGGGNMKDAVVYLDGKAKGVLKYVELPASLKPFFLPEYAEFDSLAVPRYYRLADYLQAVGIDLSKAHEIHVYGSHDRVAIITAEELRELRDKVIFDFTQEVGGKARARWSQTHAFTHKPMVDVILGIAVYAEKAPPTFAHGEQLVDGKPIDDPIPYVGDGVPKGTRVYVDGKLTGWVRRKSLPSKLVAPKSEPGQTKFSTDAFLAWVGADARNAKAIDFYDSDTMLARVEGRSWALSKSDYLFELPQRSHGQVKEIFPGDKSSRLTAIQVYVHTTPPARTPDPAALEQQGGSDEAQSGGDGSGNGGGNGGGNGSNSRVTAVAQGVNNGSAQADNDEF